MRGFFHRGDKFQPLAADDERPDQRDFEGLWVKCPKCAELVYSKELQDSQRVCPKCSYHFRLRARERIAMLADEGSFEEWDTQIVPEDRLHFADGSGPYDRKLRSTQQKSHETEALITGRAQVGGHPL